MRDVRLLEYLPPEFHKYTDIRTILEAQDPEFELLNRCADYVRNQMFVITAGDGGLARFERLLGITPADGESIETRRANVLMQWDSETPHTMRYLIALLEVLTGGDFEIDERFWISQMDIKITAPDIDVAMLLANLKRYIIPVNLTVNVLAFFRTWDMLWDKNMTLQQLWDRNMTLDEVGTEAMR